MVFTATAAQTLEAEAFSRLVAEEDLRVWEVDGYSYTKRKGPAGIEIYRAHKDKPRVFWTYTNRFTEAGVGGGVDVVRITPAAGTAIRLDHMQIQMCNAAAGRTIAFLTCDEDGAFNDMFGSISTDDQYLDFPNIGATTAANNTGNSSNIHIPGDGSHIYISATTLAQNEYIDVRIVCELFGTETAPTVTQTSSGTASMGTPTQNEVTVVYR